MNSPATAYDACFSAGCEAARWPSTVSPTAQARAPTTLADRNRPYGIRLVPATTGVKVRTHGIQRATTTAHQPHRW